MGRKKERKMERNAERDKRRNNGGPAASGQTATAGAAAPVSNATATRPPATAPAISVLRPGYNCATVASAQRVAFLIDGAAYFDAFVRAAERAQRRIMIIAWDFASRAALRVGEDGRPLTQLGDFLNHCARTRRHLQIHVLDWDYPMIFAHDREFPPLYGLGWKPHRRVHFRFDDTHPLAGSHHQKIVIVDDRVAFAGGLDLAARRWDTPAHRPDDPRRALGGKIYPPLHDVMVAVDGDAAVALSRIARQRWHLATGEQLDPVIETRDPWPPELPVDLTDVRIGIACTAPPVNGPIEVHPAVHHVERLYLDTIARARRYIYIENQYFTSQRIAAALGRRLQESHPPEIVLVTRQLSHGWLEEMTMHVLRHRYLTELRALDHAGRFHVYYPHVDGCPPGTCIDVHSKLMVIDDEWLRVGSSNLSNRSMGVDTECDVLIEAHGLPRVAQAIRAFRDRLLAEHLGAEPAAVAAALQHAPTLHAAIEQLGRPERHLAPLPVEPWSDGAVAAASIADMESPVELDVLTERFSATAETSSALPVWVKLALAAAVLLALTAAWRYTPLADVFTAAAVIEWTESFARNAWAPLVIIALYTPACIVMFPRPILNLAAVVAFGPALGFAYAMSGILLASTAGFYAGRAFGRNTVRRLAGKRLNQITRVLRKRGLIAVTALRLVPIAPFIVESLVAGAVHIKLRDLTLGTFFGMLPGLLTATVLGDVLHAALVDPSTINWWIVGAVLTLFAVLSYAVQRWLRRTVVNEGKRAPAVSEEQGLVR